MKNTVATFRAAKGVEKLTMLTCYDYTMACLMDRAGINAFLVGDSLGMVMLGYPDTVPVTMEEMIHHCRAVARGNENALLVCDMPFLSSQCGISETVRNGGRLLKEGRAHAVKLEGGLEYADEISALARASIPVMAHIGLTPQSVNALGGYKVQGSDLATARKVLEDAIAVEKAGAFAIVLECVPTPLARLITDKVSIPTIGIGAGNGCDGQVLVWQDMLGLATRRKPKFVREFASLGPILETALKDYKTAVQDGSFPTEAESYAMDESLLATFRTGERDG